MENYPPTKLDKLRWKLNYTEGERKAFWIGVDTFQRMQEDYNTVEYNAFGQELRPHYCVHGISNLWADYDDICMYCEEGISTPVQWGMIVLQQYRAERKQQFGRMVMKSLLSNKEAMTDYVEMYGIDYLWDISSLRRHLGLRKDSLEEQILQMQYGKALQHLEELKLASGF